MQIFVLHEDPIESGILLYRLSPVRANKMIVEGMQAIGSLCHKYGIMLPRKKDGKEYSKRPFPKPLMDWVEASEANFRWMLTMMFSIQEAMDINHASLSEHNKICAGLVAGVLPHKEQTPFCNYAKSKDKGLDFTHLPVIEAYNQYLQVQYAQNSF